MEASPLENNPKANPAVISCPFLGLVDDRESYTSYPSEWNVCYHVQPIAAPNHSHQEAYCLSTEYALCPIFNTESPQKMPDGVKLRRQISIEKIKQIGIIAVLVLFVILVIVGILFREQWLDKIPEFSSDTGTGTELINSDDRQTGTIVSPTSTGLFSEISLAPLATEKAPTDPTAALNPTKTDPILALEVPIGDEVQFVMHRVLPGESLAIFADQYNTSIDAIIAVNANLISPLWVDWVVIVPVNFSDINGLPAFEAYQVEEEGVSLEVLAERLSAAVDQMSLYNNIDTDHKLHVGEWLLVPRGNPNNN
jgi:hypothetical protein